MYKKIMIHVVMITAAALNVTGYASESTSKYNVARMIINGETPTDLQITEFNIINKYQAVTMPAPDQLHATDSCYSDKATKIMVRRATEADIFDYLL